MKRWRMVLISAVVLLTTLCGFGAWRAVFVVPAGLLPDHITNLVVERQSATLYQASFTATRSFWDWRAPVIARFSAASWVRGSLPDSSSFDRTLWFVRRREIGPLVVIEQVRMRADTAELPFVSFRYQRIFRFWDRTIDLGTVR